MPQNRLTFGWCSKRDLTNQCGTPCNWVLTQHNLACCEFDQPEFPRATHCPKYTPGSEGDE